MLVVFREAKLSIRAIDFILHIAIERQNKQQGWLDMVWVLLGLHNNQWVYSFIATFAEEETHDIGLETDDGLTATSHLAVLYKQEEKIFVTQITNTTYDDYFDAETFSVSLVSAGQYDNQRKVLHTEVLPPGYSDHRSVQIHRKSLYSCYKAFWYVLTITNVEQPQLFCIQGHAHWRVGPLQGPSSSL